MTKQISIIALALLGLGCKSPMDSASDGTKTATQPLTDVVKKQDLVGYSFFDGKMVVPPSAQATLYSPYDTPVVSVSTAVGKRVERGEPIVKLTIPGADSLAASAKSQVNSAETSLASEKSANVGPVHEAEQALKDAKAQEAAARETVAQGGQADVDTLTQARITAEENLRQARQDMNKTLQPTKEAVSQATAMLASARADAAKGIVRTPISGVVTSLKAQPGMMATSKEILATILNVDGIRIQGLVPPELKDLVVRNAKVIVAFNGPNSDPADGTVVDVTVAPPAAGQKSPGYLAVIQLENTKVFAQPNLSVRRIGIKTGTAKDVMVVPVGAVTNKGGDSMVRVKEGDAWVDKKVEVGISDGALIAIKSGLSEGQTVQVVSPSTTSQKM